MLSTDALYGQISLPDYVADLMATPLVQRLHGITQDSAPRSCIPWTVPSRFDHSVGVAFLATLVVANNQLSEREARLLVASALLHDAGNTAWSHVGETYLHALTGRDGESNIARTLRASPTENILNRLGLDTSDVIRMICGRAKPFCRVLHGTMDVDNLDNVARYWQSVRGEFSSYDGPRIASAFRWRNDAWHLDGSVHDLAGVWQHVRRRVYDIVYGTEHLSSVLMLERALDLTLRDGQLSEDFFLLDDNAALEMLQQLHPAARYLIGQILRSERYQEVFTFNTHEPSAPLIERAKNWRARYDLADIVAASLNISEEHVCARIGFTKHHRHIDIPFLRRDGSVFYDTDRSVSQFEVRLFLDPAVSSLRNQTSDIGQAFVTRWHSKHS